MKPKNKKAQGGGFPIEKLMSIALVIFVVALVILGILRLQGNTWLSNLFPTLGLEKKENASDITGQPKEFRAEDACVDYLFYWSNADGGNLNGRTVEEGAYYVAVNLKSDIGNLADSKNPKYFCRDYAVIINEISGLLNTAFTFEQIQKFAKKELDGKTVYFIKVDVKDAGWAKSGEYSFKIAKDAAGKSVVRTGGQLHVEHNAWGWWW